LTVPQPQVVIGIEGSRIKDPAAVTSLIEAVGATGAEVASALAAARAHPTFFEPIITISRAQYQQLGGNDSSLYKIPGTVFQMTTARGALTPGLAAHLVGSVGPITAQELQQLGPPYNAGSVIGQSGIEAAYEKRLAGSPGSQVTVVDQTGKTVAVLATFAPKPGTAVTTSIDPATQEAAEAALTDVPGHVALVAVDADTGQILASVSQPADDQFDQSLDGLFPPGSTFKVLTASALIEAGLSPSSPASCPPTADVGGEIFHNAEGDSPVSDMAQAFTESCNTAFVDLAATHLTPSSFPSSVAAMYGIGRAAEPGLPVASGSAPTPKDTASLAATAIGQGAVVVSPLDMAMVAAAVDSGQYRPPRLVGGAPDDSAPSTPLPTAVVSGLRQMMSAVVTSGTAAGTGLPAGTYAKTGTAQFGSGNPLPTDAWLIGYRGNVAFAIVVQNSKGNGGPVDGPIVAKFLDALPSSP
jgi:cell division protein FtsI/penicillin-binding protein 2